MALLSTSASVRFNSRSSGDRLSVVVSGLNFGSSCSVDVKKAGLKYEVPRSKTPDCSSQVNTAPCPLSLELLYNTKRQRIMTWPLDIWKIVKIGILTWLSTISRPGGDV